MKTVYFVTRNGCRLGPGFFSRWSALAASFIVNAFNLYSYAFGLFSNALKHKLEFSQGDIDIIASVGELGLWSTFLVGLMLERLSPRQVYLVGSASTAVGLGYVALALGTFLPSNPAFMAIMFFLANFGTACYAQTATAIAVRNFPSADRGKVAGLIKSVFGLSSAILGVLYAGFFDSTRAGKFLLLLSVGVPILGILSSIPLNVVPAKHLSYALERAQGVSPHMTPFYVWFTVIASTLVAAVLAEALHVNLPVPWTGLAIVGLVFVVASLPMLYGHMYVPDVIMLQREGISIHRISNERTRSDGSLPNGSTGDYRLEDDDLLEGEGFPLLGSVDNVGDSRTLDLNSPNMTWKQCLKDGRFWTLYVTFLCGAGSGLVVINNVASLADSLGMVSSDVLVTALGLANALGRLAAGWVSDRIVGAGFPRASLFCAMLLVTSAVDFLLAAGVKNLLYPLSVAAGICYGSMFSLVLALAGDLFGAEHIGTNYGLLDLGPAVGSFVFATGVVDFFYSREGEEGTCLGPQCFGGTFFCTGIACLVVCIISYVVLVRQSFGIRMRRAEA